jgi:hypothetical protein
MKDVGAKCFGSRGAKYFSGIAGTYSRTWCLSKRSQKTANREMLVLSGWEKGKRTR